MREGHFSLMGRACRRRFAACAGRRGYKVDDAVARLQDGRGAGGRAPVDPGHVYVDKVAGRNRRVGYPDCDLLGVESAAGCWREGLLGVEHGKLARAAAHAGGARIDLEARRCDLDAGGEAQHHHPRPSCAAASTRRRRRQGGIGCIVDRDQSGSSDGHACRKGDRRRCQRSLRVRSRPAVVLCDRIGILYGVARHRNGGYHGDSYGHRHGGKTSARRHGAPASQRAPAGQCIIKHWERDPSPQPLWRREGCGGTAPSGLDGRFGQRLLARARCSPDGKAS